MRHLFHRFIYFLIAICTLASGLYACSNDACKETMYTPMNIRFFHRGGDESVFSFENLSLYRVIGGELQVTEYADTANVSELVFTLNPLDTVSKYYLRSEELRDTIIIYHKNTEEFVSSECGGRMTYTLDSVFFAGGHAEDSISIFNHKVEGRYNVQNVKIYIE